MTAETARRGTSRRPGSEPGISDKHEMRDCAESACACKTERGFGNFGDFRMSRGQLGAHARPLRQRRRPGPSCSLRSRPLAKMTRVAAAQTFAGGPWAPLPAPAQPLQQRLPLSKAPALWPVSHNYSRGRPREMRRQSTPSRLQT